MFYCMSVQVEFSDYILSPTNLINHFFWCPQNDILLPFQQRLCTRYPFLQGTSISYEIGFEEFVQEDKSLVIKQTSKMIISVLDIIYVLR